MRGGDIDVRCLMANSYSQHLADLFLLPFLLHAAGGQPGTFVELGAFDGVTYSNTFALEHCGNWTGLLIEASPRNYERLKAETRRRVHKVHSAVCSHEQQARGLEMSGVGSGPSLALKELDDAKPGRRSKSTARPTDPISNVTDTVKVPCQPLSSLMASAGLARGAHFLSLDVEGAEEMVLSTVDPAIFSVVLIEMSGVNPGKDARTHNMLLRSGFWQARGINLSGNSVFVSHKIAQNTPSKYVAWCHWQSHACRGKA